MKICIIHPSYEGSSSPFAGRDPECSPARYAAEHEWISLRIRKATAGAQIRDVARGVDLFFNLCDAFWDEDLAGIDVVRLLEQLNLPYTGADSRFYEPTRETIKRACRYVGVETPRWRMATTIEEVERAGAELRFPLIAKHPNSYGSIGMTRDSRVSSIDELHTEAARFIATFGGVMIEEFIDGREFTVLVSEHPDGDEPHTYAPVECRFPPGESFKHFDLKWIGYEDFGWMPVQDEALARRLQSSAARLFAGLNGNGYARADFRVDASGTAYIIDINPQPGIFYPDGEFGSADIILAGDPGGHPLFVQRVIAAGMARHTRRQSPFEIRDNSRGAYGLYATRNIGAGETIDAWESRPQRVMTHARAEALKGWERAWFHQCAWPLGDDLFAVWSDDPAEWRPIDHSCDPNAWLSGLDVVARRAITRGEAITCDYGTFFGDTMTTFECDCGSSNCRRRIQGTDYLLPAISVYGEHVSPWVAARRRRLDVSVAELGQVAEQLERSRIG